MPCFERDGAEVGIARGPNSIHIGTPFAARQRLPSNAPIESASPPSPSALTRVLHVGPMQKLHNAMLILHPQP